MKFLGVVIIFMILEKSIASECKVNLDYFCVFTGVKTTKNDPLFYPRANSDISDFNQVSFKSSSIHTFTNEICEAFPHVTRINADDISLKKVSSDALNACPDLVSVEFNNNQLDALDVDVFEKNRKLKYLWLNSNKLTRINGMMFEPTGNLEDLGISNNFLSKLPLDDLPNLSKFRVFHFEANDILAFDAEKLVKKFPSLQYVSFNDNLFDCDNIKKILNALKVKPVNIDVRFKGVRTRNFLFNRVENVSCVTQAQKPIVYLDQSWSNKVLKLEKVESDMQVELEGVKLDNEKLQYTLRWTYITFIVLIIVVLLFFIYFHVCIVRCFVKRDDE